jgi:hypothetical protein
VAQQRNFRTWTETMRPRATGARILVDAAIAEGVPVYIHESVLHVYADGKNLGCPKVLELMMAGRFFCAPRLRAKHRQTGSPNKEDETSCRALDASTQ